MNYPYLSSQLAASKRFNRWIYLPLVCFLLLVLNPAAQMHAQTEPSPQAGKLPSDSQNLVDRLKEYEDREKTKLDKLLNRKRSEVLAILKKQFKFRTQKGQLDQALAIRKEIERIEDLLPQAAPSRLTPTRKKFELNGQILPTSKTPAYFELDIDEQKGKIYLEFEHLEMARLLDKSKNVYLELKIDKQNPGAGSVNSIIVKHGVKIIGEHSKPNPGDVVKIKLDAWKIAQTGRTLTLLIENSGKDRIGIRTDIKDDFAALLFSGEKLK
ncbi:MAG: hypothetical protein H7A51_16270 [Akkermansiaceae bacterium]|nr:hypothetical protein [Akkermansiaceae bacterium]